MAPNWWRRAEHGHFFGRANMDIARRLSEEGRKRNPAFARDLMHKLIGRVRSLTNKVTDLALRDVYGRFVRFIDEHAVEQDGIRQVPERLTQHDIAVRIGGSREMVSRIIKELAAGGYISIDAKRVIVHKKLPAKW